MEENEEKRRISKREKIKKSKKRLELGKRIRRWDRREIEEEERKGIDSEEEEREIEDLLTN